MTRKRWTISFEPEGEAGLYEVTVRRSGAVHRFTTRLPPDIADLWSASADSAATRSFRSASAAELTPESRFFQAADLPTLKDIGERVFDAIFDTARPGEGPKIVGALEDRIADNEGVVLEIDLSQTAELSGIPWESLYLRSRDRFLAIGTTSNIVRKLDTQSELPPPIARPLRILVVAANPWKDLQTGVELGNIEERIDKLVADGQTGFEIEALPAARRETLRRKINEWRPHVIHYIGHSDFENGEGYLALETDEAGVGDKLSAETLRNMLVNNRPWLVVLNSCRSGQTSAEAPMAGVAQNLLQRINVPFVIGMQQPVSDEAAIAFSQDFYTALLGGETIADAVTMGRAAIASGHDKRTQVELITPALYTSGETDSIAFTGPPPAAAVAAVAAPPPSPEPKAASEGWLEGIDKKTKVVASIVASVMAITAGIAAIGESTGWFSDDEPTQEVAAPAAGQVSGETSREQVTVERAPVAQSAPISLPGPPPIEVRTVSRSLPRRAERRISDPRVASGPVDADPIGRTVPVRSRERSIPVAAGRTLPVDASVASAAPPPVSSRGTTAQSASISSGATYSSEVIAADPSENAADYTSRDAAEGTDPSSSIPVAARTFRVRQQGRAVILPDITMPAPLTELGPTQDFDRVMLEPQRMEEGYRSEDRENAAIVGTLDQPRDPAFCDGLVLRVPFDAGSTSVSAADRARLEQIGDQIACPSSALVVAGLTDTTGDPDYNADLSLERARAVADIVLDRPAARQLRSSAIQGYGERYPLVATGEGVAEAANRRAEVYFQPACEKQSRDITSFAPARWEAEVADLIFPKVGNWAGQRVVVAYNARSMEEYGGGVADDILMRIATMISEQSGIPPGAIYPVKYGPGCLQPDENARIDIVM